MERSLLWFAVVQAMLALCMFALLSLAVLDKGRAGIKGRFGSCASLPRNVNTHTCTRARTQNDRAPHRELLQKLTRACMESRIC